MFTKYCLNKPLFAKIVVLAHGGVGYFEKLILMTRKSRVVELFYTFFNFLINLINLIL